ncbi:MAG: ABC transporter permease [Erysipelotrichaceae bacterium]
MLSTYLSANWIGSFLYSIIRISTPLIFASLGACFTKKAGLMNMALESMMLVSALTGVLASAFSQNLIIGMLGAIAGALAVGGIICYCAFYLKTDLYLTSISMNLASVGGTVFALYLICGQKSNSAGILKSLSFPKIDIPILQDIPIIGTALSGHSILTYLAFLMVLVVYFVLNKTRIGLRITASGENPNAVESVGISVRKIRTISFLLSSILCGLAGAYMSMSYVNWFARDMISGRGFISMSATNISNASPFLTCLCAMLFGLSQATANAMQITNAPAELVSALPYVATIIFVFSFAIIQKQRAKAAKKKILVKIQKEQANDN